VDLVEPFNVSASFSALTHGNMVAIASLSSAAHYVLHGINYPFDFLVIGSYLNSSVI
jgi:hypothetical protein